MLQVGVVKAQAKDNSEPADIAADFSEGLIFVSEIGNNRIQKFDINGNFLGMWGTTGKGRGQFNHVGDVSLDNNQKNSLCNRHRK